MSKNIFLRRFLAGIFAVFICSALFGLAQARIVESVSILMAAPFADATQDLVKKI
jgi:multiple sugar transport system substrate-binding protein